jgi:PQQ-like domain
MPPVHGAPRVVLSLRLDGEVYASPIVANGITVVATEHDSVYGFDDSGRQLWHSVLGAPAPKADLPCGNIDPLGITGTPVYDAATGLVYAVAEHASPVRHELVALRVGDGTVSWRSSVDLPGVDARAMQQRGALTIADGRVWVPFGGLAGDCAQYKGRVVAMALDGSGSPSAYTVPTSREAGIWTPPGPTVDAAGHLFVSVGNGEAGVGDAYDHSDSVLELDGTSLVDSFSPSTWATDNDADLDLGSQGPALVEDRWVFVAGKSGTAYVLRYGHLGGIGGQVSSSDVCASFGGTAVSGDVVYVPCTDGVRAVRIGADGTLTVWWHADSNITGSPVLGGGRVWALDPKAGRLFALDPATGRVDEQVVVGVTSRFSTPALHGPFVLIPANAGLVVVRVSS